MKRKKYSMYEQREEGVKETIQILQRKGQGEGGERKKRRDVEVVGKVGIYEEKGWWRGRKKDKEGEEQDCDS